MRNVLGPLALVALLALASPLVAPFDASAQDREFTGRIDRVNEKKLIVDNRMGDKVSFVRVAESIVEGAKSDWKELKTKDWVTVHWNLVDKPRKAYKVVVLPPKEEQGEDL